MDIKPINTKHSEFWGNAFSLKKALDEKDVDTRDVVEKYKKSLNNQLENHTIADIATQNVVKQYPIINEAEYFCNLFELEQLPEIRALGQKVMNSYDRLYPKTGYIREALISNDRFDIITNKIKPKMNFLQKLRDKYNPHF